MTRQWMIVATCSLALAACGGNNVDGKNNGSNNGGTNNGGSNNGGTNNGGSNNGGTNNGGTNNGGTNSGGTNNGTTGTNNGTAGTNNGTTGTNNGTTGTNNGTTGTGTEMEPNNEPDQATPLTAGSAISGTVSSDDDDLFTMALSGGTVLEVAVTSVGAPDEVYFAVADPDGLIAREMIVATGASRQFFVPEDGDYLFVVVTDAASPSAYDLSTTVNASPSPTALTVPGTQPGDLNDGAVDIYSFTAAAAGVVDVDVFAERDPVLGDLDSVLYVWNPISGLVASNDDDPDDPDSTFDSAVSFDALMGQEYWVVVDAFGIVDGGNNAYELVTATPSP